MRFITDFYKSVDLSRIGRTERTGRTEGVSALEDGLVVWVEKEAWQRGLAVLGAGGREQSD